MTKHPAPSSAARACAAEMRAFDPGLTAADIAAIARGIDAQRALGAALVQKKKRFANDLAPITAVMPPDPAA